MCSDDGLYSYIVRKEWACYIQGKRGLVKRVLLLLSRTKVKYNIRRRKKENVTEGGRKEWSQWAGNLCRR